jgi:hypothetical protein
MAVKFDGGEALEPLLLGQPLSKGVAIAMINMQNNFFTVEFLKRTATFNRDLKNPLKKHFKLDFRTTAKIHDHARK